VTADPQALDGVLLDMTMPEMSGATVFERLRTIRPDLPVVLMSGYHADEIDPALAAATSGFVQKPFTAADLARRMRVALERNGDGGVLAPSSAGSAADEPLRRALETPAQPRRDGI
jgi:CheY-like chemotaxis protein